MIQNDWSLSKGGQPGWKNETRLSHKELGKFRLVEHGTGRPWASPSPGGRDEVERRDPTPMWKPEGTVWNPLLDAPQTRISVEDNAPEVERPGRGSSAWRAQPAGRRERDGRPPMSLPTRGLWGAFRSPCPVASRPSVPSGPEPAGFSLAAPVGPRRAAFAVLCLCSCVLLRGSAGGRGAAGGPALLTRMLLRRFAVPRAMPHTWEMRNPTPAPRHTHQYTPDPSATLPPSPTVQRPF